jgi:hypothetical protein
MKIGDTYYRVIRTECSHRLGDMHKVIAIDIYGRVFMELVNKPKSAVSFWEAKDVENEENFEKV